MLLWLLHLVHTTDTDNTRLSCLVSGVNRIGDKSRQFLVVFASFRNWTKQFPNFLLPTVLTCRLFCLHHRHGLDKTRQSCLSCPCQWCEQNWRQVKTVFSSPHCILGVETAQSSVSFPSPTVLSCRQFCSLRQHGQDKMVLSCAHRWYEQGITQQPGNSVGVECQCYILLLTWHVINSIISLLFLVFLQFVALFKLWSSLTSDWLNINVFSVCLLMSELSLLTRLHYLVHTVAVWLCPSADKSVHLVRQLS